MEMMELLTAIGGLMMAIIGFFLRQTMQELKDIKEVAYKTKTKVEVLENDYLNKVNSLNSKFDLLYNAIDKLTDKIEELNKRIK
jgi:peptidoglycan hydrolase CwlO-like protein